MKKRNLSRVSRQQWRGLDLQKIIDAHIHLDLYSEFEQKEILTTLEQNDIAGLITVSNHLESAKKNLELDKEYENVFPAFGFHPEQVLPKENEMVKLINFIKQHENEMVAIGEVGLPYYLRKEEKDIELEAYLELLEQFILLAKEVDKPIILHAIYEDAPLACSLLEKHSVTNAHFHWFKGDQKTLERMKANGYYISFTPDITYKKEIQNIAENFPLSKVMVETDGPWQFKGPFHNQMTNPNMIHESMRVIASIKQVNLQEAYGQIYQNTKDFYKIRG